jgi:hypothetical protein
MLESYPDVPPPVPDSIFDFCELDTATKLTAKRNFVDCEEPLTAIHSFVEQQKFSKDRNGTRRVKVVPPIRTESTSAIPMETEHVTPAHTKPNTTDVSMAENSPFEFIDYLNHNPSSKEFIYLVYAQSYHSNQLFNPYNLKRVDFSQIDLKSGSGFFTLSSEVCYSNSGCDSLR